MQFTFMGENHFIYLFIFSETFFLFIEWLAYVVIDI